MKMSQKKLISNNSDITDISKPWDKDNQAWWDWYVGLAENDIPLGSRLIMIADTYDAICSNRPYRKALSSEEALEIIQKGAGTQFDPNLLPIFESTYKDFPCATTTNALPQ